MRTVTIYLKAGNEIFTGATARGKTLQKAIINAYNKTDNHWHLNTYIKGVDGSLHQFEICSGIDETPFVRLIKES